VGHLKALDIFVTGLF